MKELIPNFLKIANENADSENWDTAITNYSRVLDYDSKDLEALIGISHCYIQINKYSKAEKYSKIAFENKKTEEDDIATVNYSCVLIEQNKLKKAIEILEIEKNNNSKNYLVYNNLGYAQQKEEYFCKALENYNKSIELESENPLAYCNRGELKYFYLNDPDGIKDLEKAEQLGDKDARRFLKKITTANNV